MARPRTVVDDALLEALSGVFRERGYAGASLASLSAATDLRKASLYHRFPGGKEQMAREVLGAASEWLEQNVLGPLAGPEPPRARLRAVAAQLDQFYRGGRSACLLNVLASTDEENPFKGEIKAMLERLIGALAAVAREAGATREAAQARAERTVAMLHGSLVLSRGLGSARPFKSFLATLADDLIGADR